MSMFYACDQEGKLLHIDEAGRGLACNCVCFTCGEVVLGKKGNRNKHHFAHHGGKSACTISPESVLHKLAKQAILEAQGLQLPRMPGVILQPDDPSADADQTSWWDFAEVHEEQTQNDFRPDLVANLRDGTRLFIEIAVTSFVGERKQEKIERLQEKTIELDLRYLISQMGNPRSVICKHILHDTNHKKWLYPSQPDDENLEIEANGQYSGACFIPESVERKTLEQSRFTIFGMWVNAMALPSGDLAVRSLAYNPQIVELLKGWAHELGGRYNKHYRNWQYPVRMADRVLERLAQLHSETK